MKRNQDFTVVLERLCHDLPGYAFSYFLKGNSSCFPSLSLEAAFLQRRAHFSYSFFGSDSPLSRRSAALAYLENLPVEVSCQKFCTFSLFLSIITVSRNSTSTYFYLSKFVDALLCDQIALTPGLARFY